VILKTARTILRDFRESDYSFFCALETNESTIRYEADCIPSQEGLNGMFDKMLASIHQENKVRHVFLVEGIDGIPLGKVVIWQIDKEIDEWEMGWVFHPDHMGKGYATEASVALIEFGFKELGANRICANCNDANTASERVMQRIGMQKEGVHRETRKLRGKWYGSCIYSVLRSEFGEAAQKVELHK